MKAVRFDLAELRTARRAPTSSRASGGRQWSPERRSHTSREQLLQRVRAEFEELRGLKLTLAQAQRLFGLRADVCQRVLHTLMRERFLRIDAGDCYARRDRSAT